MSVIDINPLALPLLPLAERRFLPAIPAIYFCLDVDGNVLYVGGTSNLRQRWRAHHKYTHLKSIDVRLAWLECSDLCLLPEIESALIDYFNPPLNRLSYSVGTKTATDSLEGELICKLPQLMEAKGINQKDLAAATGLSPTTISKLYRNQLDRFDRNTVLKLGQFFSCKSISELIDIDRVGS